MAPSPPPTLLKTHLKPYFNGAQPAYVRSTSIASILRLSTADDDDAGDGPYFDLEFSIPELDSDSDVAIGDGLRSSSLSPSDELFFKGRRSSVLFTPSAKPHFPSSFLKSATKFRVFMLRFKRTKSKPSPHLDPPPQSSPKSLNKRFSIKFKLDSAKLYAEEAIQLPAAAATTSNSDEKKKSKDVIQKYLNKIKSKRYTDPVAKRLRKSRSASSSAAVEAAWGRRDDSLTQHEDGIQSAIAHCKRSFHGGKGSDLGLARSKSHPGAE